MAQSKVNKPVKRRPGLPRLRSPLREAPVTRCCDLGDLRLRFLLGAGSTRSVDSDEA